MPVTSLYSSSDGGVRRSMATQLVGGYLAFDRFGGFFFSAGRCTHMISLFLPSCGGVSMECSKKGCQSSKTLFI